MSNLLHRQLASVLPTAARGDGVYLFDREGRRYLDGSAGGGVSCLGHNNQDVIEAMKAQLGRLAYANNSVFTNEPAEAAAELLASHAPPSLQHVYFVSSGAEAVEAALKITRQYFVEIGERERRTVVSRWHSFHGNTLGALSAGGNATRRALFEPLLADVKFLSACYAYREQKSSETLERYGERIADELETLVNELGPKAIAAFIAEPVVGATLGAVPAVKGYFRRIREICDRYGIVLILDEVMCGMGRTGTLFAFEQDRIVPDIVCVSKALGSGYQPVAATMISNKIWSALAAGSGVIEHFQTYQAHPVACAAALAVLKQITRREMIAQVSASGEYLMQLLRERIGDHPHVGDIRGRGLFVGVEFVRDRRTKERFGPEKWVNVAVRLEAMALGLTVTGPIGMANDCALLSPPYIVTRAEIEQIAELFCSAIERTIARPERERRPSVRSHLASSFRNRDSSPVAREYRADRAPDRPPKLPPVAE